MSELQTRLSLTQPIEEYNGIHSCPKCKGEKKVTLLYSADSNHESSTKVKCPHCFGLGVVDWVSFVVKQNKEFPKMPTVRYVHG